MAARGPPAAGRQPTSAGAGATSLNGVSCQTARNCLAVGSTLQPDGHTTAAGESWDGTAWRAAVPPVAAAAASSKLTSVWCYSADRCAAVGIFTSDQDSHQGLAAYWDHGTWTAGPAPYHGAGDTLLNGISCGSPARCVTVGLDIDPAGSRLGMAAQEWDGSRWRPFPDGPALPPAHTPMPSALSCWDATSCLAVGGAGMYVHANDGKPAAWALGPAGHWAPAPVPPPAGGAGGTLLGVACPAPDQCMAVGEIGPIGRTQHGLAGQWNGTSWRLTTIT